MTMHSRPLGGGRTLAAIAGVLIIVGSVLPWWHLGGDSGLTAAGGNAFECSVIIVFHVGIVTLALVALPYAVGDRPTAVDRSVSYGLLAIVGWLGLGWRVIDLLIIGVFRFTEPAQVFTNGPGLWIAGLGLAILSRAVYRMTREPLYR